MWQLPTIEALTFFYQLNINETWKIIIKTLPPPCCGHIVNSQKFLEITVGAKGLRGLVHGGMQVTSTLLKWELS